MEIKAIDYNNQDLICQTGGNKGNYPQSVLISGRKDTISPVNRQVKQDVLYHVIVIRCRVVHQWHRYRESKRAYK